MNDSEYKHHKIIDVIEKLIDSSIKLALEKAKEIYKARVKNCTIIEPTALHNENVHSKCFYGLMKLTKFVKKAQLDIDSILQEHKKDSSLHIVQKWVESSNEPEHSYRLDNQKHQKRTYIQVFARRWELKTAMFQ